MADYAPPTGPPPPQVPAGWKAVWNAQYSEWFFVNTYTKASQWDKPTAPAQPPGDAAPYGAPPGYDHGSAKPVGPEKHAGGLGNNNPYSQTESDAELAQRLQREENARLGNQSTSTNRGESDGYYGGGASQGAPPYGQSASPYGQQAAPYGQGPSGGQPPSYGNPSPQPPQDGKKGLFSKLGKLAGGQSKPPPGQYGGYPPQQQGYGGYPPQQHYGGYPPQQHGYGGYPPPQQQYVQGKPQKHGMGALGGAGLGLGAGLLGGALIGEAMDGHDGGDGGGYGGDDGGGYGGDDGGYGGGDGGGFGGDDGGGDGGGDF